ncbi:armadillo-type protein [Syncephalis fuscata]|nr:armadillo-type protein [Syncephalis fuscata]
MTSQDTTGQVGLMSRVLALSTRGTDMADSLELLQAEAAKGDLATRKVLYGAISSQLRQRPELYASFVGQLLKNCAQSEASMRALAIRHLLHRQVVARLQDPSDDVRLQAIYGIRRLVANGGPFDDAMKKELLRIISNAHPDICLSAISVLLDVDPNSDLIGDMNIDRAEDLMGMVPDVDDAQKCIVFRYLKTFKPSSEDEILSILNTLNEYLTHTSCAVVSEVTHLFLHQSATLPAVKEDVLARAKQSLLFLISTSTSEIAFACLETLQQLCINYNMLYSTLDVAALRIKAHDPSYLTQIKLDCITSGTDAASAAEIIDELSGWIGETTPQHDQIIIKAIGNIGMFTEDTALQCGNKLVAILEDMNSGSSSTLPALIQVRKAILCALKLYVYTYISTIEVVSTHSKIKLADLARHCILCEESSQFASLSMTPYVLEFYIRDYACFSISVKLALLSTAQAVFSSQPSATQSFYTHLLRLATANEEPFY